MKTSQRFCIYLVTTALALSACSEAPSVSPDDEPSTTGTSPAVPAESEVYDLFALVSHPNGAQLRVERIEVLEDSVVVTGAINNGSPFGLRIGGGGTELRGDDDDVAALVVPFPVSEVPSSEEYAFTLVFQPLVDPQEVTLVFNSGSGASATDPNTTRPEFTLGPLPLDSTATRPSLPEPVALLRSVVDTTGVEMQVEGVVFTENRIGVWVRISNPLQTEARIAPTIAPSVIVDDLGNRYPLVLPEGQSFMSIPPESARSGTLAFAGRIHPDATSLNVGVNAAGSSIADGGRVYPRLVVTEVSLSGDVATVPLPIPLALADNLAHPAGVVLEWQGATFTETGTEAAVIVSNSRADSVALAATAGYLADDLGNRYPLVPLGGNPQVVVAANTSITATMVFSGRIADAAGAISMVLNDGQSATDPESRQPLFQAGPHLLDRTGAIAEPVTPRLFAVGPRSRLVPDELAVSEVDQITQTLAQFDATEVEGGFQLTLPDSILFDFGSADLRTDAMSALALIAEVLAFYDGAPVIVVGHTDSIGSDSRNQSLSVQRAESVVAALSGDHGVDPARLSAEGRGESEPVAPNSTPEGVDSPEGRQLNRRVEVLVLTDQPLPQG